MKILLIHILLYIMGCSGQALIFPDYRNHPCKRDCPTNGLSMTCHYKLTLEFIYSMEPDCLGCPHNEADCYLKGCVVADGTSRLIYAFNRIIPSPLIEVCLGDRLIVDIENNLDFETTTIHWHGILQRKSQWMDGVPFITQCPIQPYTTFRYNFIASDPGTHFYHSHSGFQRTNGIGGGLVVHRPKSLEPNGALYDRDLSEHVVLFTDWYKYEPITFSYQYYKMKYFDFNVVSTILINGFGSSGINNVPYYRFNVTKGLKYRFRLISNGQDNCPIKIKIDNHRFAVISSDGIDMKPIDMDSIYINSGERYDIVITANQTASSYWIRMKGYGSCNEKQAFAVLQYNLTNLSQPLPEANPVNTTTPDGQKLNCNYEAAEMNNCTSVAQLHSLTPIAQNLRGTPNVKLFLGFNFLNAARKADRGVNDTELYIHAINRISFTTPSTPLLQNPTQTYCNDNNTNCTGILCQCLHGYEIPYNSLVELILVNVGGMFDDITHPMHLHGYSYNVVGGGRFPNTNVTVGSIQDLDQQGLLPRNLIDAPGKDSLAVGDFEYAIIRFRTDNPGIWFFHCHIGFHLKAGMTMVFKVGNNHQMPRLPHNFPRCGNYYG